MSFHPNDECAEEVVTEVEKERPDVVFIGQNLPGGLSGTEAAAHVMPSHSVPVVLLAGLRTR